MIKSIIVDDERHSRQLLEVLLKRYCQDIKLLGQASSVAEAVELINRQAPDLIFLDIEMPGGDGFELLKQFNNASFLTCFVTGYSEYAVKAIKFGVFDYLLKPVDIQELKQTIKKAREALSEWKDRNPDHEIIIQEGDRFWVVDKNKIINISAESNYSMVYTTEGKRIISTIPLNQFESMLDENEFFRCHKSHIIKLGMIKSYELTRTGIIEMENNMNIPLAARRKNRFTELFSNNRGIK
ncbi:MAG: response regulator transcription factor [Saprospiraceae bacterium]|nr:LytTR family DNA-binding domain-containing protein [Bacteroidia bacterium]NNF21857.1 response regulator transcription factor [Saprospiraceae bacterium]NNK90210.1 response regulator transcription factor [Saprospiraceae bacterium]